MEGLEKTLKHEKSTYGLMKKTRKGGYKSAIIYERDAVALMVHNLTDITRSLDWATGAN